MLTVAIVGSPNVGKSTLFNRLVGRKNAITYNRPGVTRDYKEEPFQVGDRNVRLIDTGGWCEDNNEMASQIITKVKKVFDETDLILFIIDHHIVGERERLLSSWLHKNRADKRVVLVVNKCDKSVHYNSELDFFDNTVYVSAEHNIGISDIYIEILNCKTPQSCDSIKGAFVDSRICILGQPNAGKSTLINKLVGYDRVITSDEPGTTRDSIKSKIKFGDKVLELVDTAGIRKSAKIVDDVERLIVRDAINAIQGSDVVCLMIDGSVTIERQDKRIVSLANRFNKPLIVIINKWDLVGSDMRRAVLHYIAANYSKIYGFGVEIINISALHDSDFSELLRKSLKLAADCRSFFNTASLNRWLLSTVSHHSPPLSSKKKAIRFKYINQISKNPVTLRVAVNFIEVSDSYINYLTNDFRRYFKLSSVPILIKLHKNPNPYIHCN